MLEVLDSGQSLRQAFLFGKVEHFGVGRLLRFLRGFSQ